MKAVDPNHLVTVGEEGFWAAYDADSVYNPGNGWASLTGDNFTAQHAFDDIDFCGVHYWPDLWVRSGGQGLIATPEISRTTNCRTISFDLP